MTGLFKSLKSLFSSKNVYSFVVAKSFKGFRKFPMEVNLDPEAKKNNLKFKNVDVAGMTLEFRDISADRIDVYLDNIKIGYLWEQKGLNELRNNMIAEFSVKFEEDHVYDADKSETRFRAHLLAKYK